VDGVGFSDKSEGLRFKGSKNVLFCDKFFEAEAWLSRASPRGSQCPQCLRGETFAQMTPGNQR